MIKVEHTKKHCITFIVSNASHPERFEDVLVADAELVLVVLQYDAKLSKKPNGILNINPLVGVGLKQILISRTEKIKVGDKFLVHIKENVGHEHHNKILTCKETGKTGIWSVELEKDSIFYNQNVFKILALPEHFSPQQLQDIVDGKLKEGKCLVECERYSNSYATVIDEVAKDSHKHEIRIKLNPHITIYPVEEKMYSRLEVREFCEAAFAEGTKWDNGPDHNFEEWFEQNVK